MLYLLVILVVFTCCIGYCVAVILLYCYCIGYCVVCCYCILCMLYVVVFLQQGRMAMPIVGGKNYQSINQLGFV